MPVRREERNPATSTFSRIRSDPGTISSQFLAFWARLLETLAFGLGAHPCEHELQFPVPSQRPGRNGWPNGKSGSQHWRETRSKQLDNADSGVAEEPKPTPAPAVQLPAPEKGNVYGFQDLILHGKDLAGKVVQVEVLHRAGHKTDLHDGRYCITLYDPRRVFGFVYCTKEGLQKLGFEDGTVTKNQLVYLLLKKDRLTGTVSYTAVGTRFEIGGDGNRSYSW